MNRQVVVIITVCLVYMIVQTASQHIKSIREIRYDEEEFDPHNIIVPTITFYQLGGLSVGNEFLRQLTLPQHQRNENDENLPPLDRQNQDNSFDCYDDYMPPLDSHRRGKFSNYKNEDRDGNDLISLESRLDKNLSENCDDDDPSVSNTQLNSNNKNTKVKRINSSSITQPTPQQWMAFIDAISNSRNHLIFQDPNQQTI